MEYLFSYGSNNPEQLATRLKKEKIDIVIPAYYPNYRLAFGGWSKNWLGGVATMIPVPISPQSSSLTQNNSNSKINSMISANNITASKKNSNKIVKSISKTKTKTKSSRKRVSMEEFLSKLNIHENIFGYLTLLSKDDFTKLDVFEAVKYGKYTREKIEVTTNTGEKIIAHTYFLTPKAIGWVGSPSQSYLEAIYKTQSSFWSNKFKVIPIVRADDNTVVDEWTADIYTFNTKLGKIIKKYISDKNEQLITMAKLDILGFNKLDNIKKKFNKESKKLLIDMDLEISNLGYFPFQYNFQKAIENSFS